MSYNQATENLVCKVCRGKISKGEWYEEDKNKCYHLDCSNLDTNDNHYSEYEEDDKELRRRQRHEEREAKMKILGVE
jgi:hypothetical protein